ncbi:MAG: hypothetical protein JNL61_17870 [Rhizobiaceae bacterium]|nr:hypothetical protein [Rhizobiaceae bacterium]
MLIDIDRLIARARDDFEFKRETRYLNGTIALSMDGEKAVLDFADGKLTGVGSGTSSGHHRIEVGGTAEQWSQLLMDKPVPFYQCIQSAAVRHGMTISATDETFAYLPALNRLTTLMRDVRNGRA